MSFVIEVASVPDRDEVVAEIWHNNVMVAELQKAGKGCLVLEIYSSISGEAWRFDFQEWISALNEAKKRLA